MNIPPVRPQDFAVVMKAARKDGAATVTEEEIIKARRNGQAKPPGQDGVAEVPPTDEERTQAQGYLDYHKRGLEAKELLLGKGTIELQDPQVARLLPVLDDLIVEPGARDVILGDNETVQNETLSLLLSALNKLPIENKQNLATNITGTEQLLKTITEILVANNCKSLQELVQVAVAKQGKDKPPVADEARASQLSTADQVEKRDSRGGTWKQYGGIILGVLGVLAWIGALFNSEEGKGRNVFAGIGGLLFGGALVSKLPFLAGWFGGKKEEAKDSPAGSNTAPA